MASKLGTGKLITKKCENILEEASYDEDDDIIDRIKQSIPKVEVSKVLKVNNPYLTGMYELVKAEYRSRNETAVVKELKLFHCTSESAVDSIVEDNLDWRRVHRARYGLGNCFSCDADYANCHSNRDNGNDRALILFKVLVCRESQGSYDLEVLNDGDTAVGGPNNIVYVKFNDNEFLPLYVAYYEGERFISKSKYYRNY